STRCRCGRLRPGERPLRKRKERAMAQSTILAIHPVALKMGRPASVPIARPPDRDIALPPMVRPPAALEESVVGAAAAGWVIIAAFFGLLGTWAATAPLNGAVVANGVVKVEGNRKSVQHLDGGIVKQLRVREGDRVKAGDLLVVLDDSQARAEFDVLSEQYV